MHPGLADPPDDHGLRDPGATQRLDPAAEPQDAMHDELIAQRGKSRVEVIPQTDTADADTGLAHAFGDQQR